MRRPVRSALAALLLLLGAAPAARAQATRALYVSGAVYNSSFQVTQNVFGTVDPLTGAFTQIAVTGAGFGALTVAGDGAVYGLGANGLSRIDPLTGAVTFVGPTNAGGAVLLGLAATGPAGATLTGRDGRAAAGLVTVDPATGALSNARGALGADDARDVLTQGDDGLLYLVGDSTVAGVYSNTLSTVDLLTGAKTLVGSTAYVDLAGLTDVGATSLYGFGRCLVQVAVRNCVVEVNRATGAMTRTARQPGFLVLSAAAAPLGAGGGTPPVSAVPEPTTVALVGAGAGVLGLTARRRRRRAD